MTLNRMRSEFEKIVDSLNAKDCLTSCCCRYLELTESELKELSELSAISELELQTSDNENRFIFYGNRQCRNDKTNEASVGYTYIEVREIESDISEFEYSN